MKKLFLFFILSINSILFANNLSLYSGLELGVKEEKLLSILKENKIEYKYNKDNQTYLIKIPDDLPQNTICENILLHISKKKRLYQIEFLFSSKETSKDGFARIFKQVMTMNKINEKPDPKSNPYKHSNTYAYWRKMFYIIEEYFNPGLCISMTDTRWVDK